MKSSEWQARSARASDLVTQFPASAELLRFYARIAEFQGRVYECLFPQTHADGARPLREQLDPGVLVPHFPSLLEIVEKHGPQQLAATAHELRAAGEARWRELLLDHIAALKPADQRLQFFARACVEPYAEHLGSEIGARHMQAAGTCPACGDKPVTGVLRPEGEGARRSLVCSFCLTEWDFRRVICPMCGEEDHQRVPVYDAEEYPHIRLESCDTCRHYLLTVDLSKDGLAVPVADEIAAAPLGLWARERGYEKVAANLLGI